jgi:gliding motility-associated-like protein
MIGLYLNRLSFNMKILNALSTALVIALVATVAPSEALAQVSITCPADISTSNDPGQCGAVVTYVEPVGTGSGTNITTTRTGGLPSGDVFPVGTTLVEYTVTNDEGDSDVCTFEVVVADTEDPVIDCPPDIVVDANDNECTQAVTFDIPSGTDNCGPVTVIQIGGLPSGSLFPVGESFLDFQTTDGAGNSAFCRIVVVVNDVTVPEITCPDDIVVDVFNSCDTVINYIAPIGIDACGPASTAQIAGLGSGGTFPVGTTIETYQVTDQDGNTATCSFNIVVADAAAPEILNCPADIAQIAPPGSCEAVVNFVTPTVSDNCPGASITQTEGPASGSSFPVGVTTVVFAATDAAGNTTECSFEVTITEETNPQIVCPADILVSNDLGECGALVDYVEPVGADNCPSPTTALIAGLGPGAFFPVGTTTETYEVTDASGNTAQCSFTITVEDSEAPTIDCPSDINAPTDPGICEAVVTFADPTFTDNCPGGTITQTAGLPSGSSFPTGVSTIEYTATDDAGTQQVCSFDIIVNDEQFPEITCPDDISLTILSGGCDTIVTYADPIFTDNCPGASIALVSGPSSGDLLSAGDYTVTYEVTDGAGNTEQCSFNIGIEDTNDPVFDCPADLTVDADPGACEAIVNFSPPTASDPCVSVTVTQTGGPASGSTFPAGSTPIEFTAEDEFGNTSICTFNVIVVDTDNPTISCPEDISVFNDIGLCDAIVSYDAPLVDDNCGVESVTLIAGLPSGDAFPVGETSVTYEVVDVSGNSAQCAFTVEVIDNEAPVISCPADIDLILPDGDCEAVVTFPDPTATDNCAVASVSITDGLPSGSSFPLGVNTVTFEAIDVNGLSTSCTLTINVTEEVAPTIDCPLDIIVDNDSGACGATVSYTPPVGVDNCGEASTVLTAGLGNGGFFPVGVTTEEYTVTDLSGNTASCSFTVTVIDNELPVLDCPADVTIPTDAGECGAIVAIELPEVTDNCENDLIPIQTEGPVSGSLFPVGTTTISFEATDAAGNVGTCSYNIIVVDEENPEITCPENIEVDAGIECSTVVNFPDATATDNCGVASIIQTNGPLSGSEFPIGITTVSFEAVDDQGNSSACSFTVTVIEQAPPSITCPSDITVPNAPENCSAVVTYDDPVAEDDCGSVTITLIDGLASGEEFPVGTTTVTFEAEDEQGNTAQCSFTVTVTDDEAPAFDCPEPVAIVNDEGECGAIVNFELPTSADNCSSDVTVFQTEGPPSGSLFPVGLTTLTFEGTDDAGNIGICSYTVTVSDEESPVFTDCPADISIDLLPSDCDTLVSYEPPTVLDNCAVSSLIQVSGPSSGDLLSSGSYTVEFEAIDNAGNSAICSFNIQVNDVTAPAIICPESFESCDVVVTLPLPTVSDECGEVTINQIEGPTSGSTFPFGVSEVVFEVLDENGNSTLCAYEVDVLTPATRPSLGPDRNICDSTSTLLSGNQPDFGFGAWFQIEGSGTIEDPSSNVTIVSDLSVGVNSFIWSIDPDNGCDILSDTISITVEDVVELEAGPDQNILSGASTEILTFIFPPDGTIEWSPPDGLSCADCPNPIASPSETTQYFITYETPLGCEITDSLVVKVFLEIPNTITPDNDGVNDVWNIPGIENFPDVSVQIYNRWGVEVFSSTGYNEPWDGTTNEEELGTGSYFYVINYNTEGVENMNGTVNIIR